MLSSQSEEENPLLAESIPLRGSSSTLDTPETRRRSGRSSGSQILLLLEQEFIEKELPALLLGLVALSHGPVEELFEVN